MLQKLPKTVGDTVTLGTPIAIGICPTLDNKRFTSFVSFECKGELVSYEITDHSVLHSFSGTILGLLDKSTSEAPERVDFVCQITADGYKILYPSGNVYITHKIT